MPARCPKLRYATYTKRGEHVAHVVCHHLTPGYVQHEHTHDFAEVFWGVSGTCRHIVNGSELSLKPGQLVLLRPADRHELCALDEDCVYYLVCIPPKTYATLQTAYARQIPELWNEKNPMPHTVQLSPLQRKRFDNTFHDLLQDPQNHLLVDRFLLNLLYEIRDSRLDPYRNCPAWLQEALEALNTPEWFSLGCTALEQLTGRSREHVARVLKHSSNTTPSQAVHRARIDHAASRLVTSQDSVLRIAMECGYASLGHFYKEFQKAHAMPPRLYRQTHRQLDTPHA